MVGNENHKTLRADGSKTSYPTERDKEFKGFQAPASVQSAIAQF